MIQYLKNSWNTSTPLYTKNYFRYIKNIIFFYVLILSSSWFIHSDEYFSQIGVFPDKSIFSWIFFPGFFSISDSSLAVKSFFLIFWALLFLFFLKKNYRIYSFLIWYSIASLVSRNPFIQSFTFDYLGLIFMSLAIIPNCKEQNWHFPKLMYCILNLILAINYSASGIYKAFHPMWQNGEAIIHTLQSGLGRNYFLQNILITSPDIILKIFTWLILVIEIFYLPMYLLKKTRVIGWSSMLIVHLCIAITTHITKMSLTIIIFHLFICPEEYIQMFENIISKFDFYSNYKKQSTML